MGKMFSSRFLQKLVSPARYASGSYIRGWRRRARLAPFTVVLVYHRVTADGESSRGRFLIEAGTPASVFESQIRFMLRYFAPIKASQALESSSQPLRFAVTFDDGYEDNFRVAAPILRRLGIPATFFVVSDYAGTDRVFWWDRLADMMRTTRALAIDPGAVPPPVAGADAVRLPLHTFAERARAYERVSALLRNGPHAALAERMDRLADALGVSAREQGGNYALMDWSQLKELVRQGFEIGSHTATHCNVVGGDPAFLRTEIITSVRSIESRVGAPVLSFAYPYGHHDGNDGVADLLREAGCRVAFEGTKGVAQAGLDSFALPRVPVNRRFHFACAYSIQDALNHSRPGGCQTALHQPVRQQAATARQK